MKVKTNHTPLRAVGSRNCDHGPESLNAAGGSLGAGFPAISAVPDTGGVTVAVERAAAESAAHAEQLFPSGGANPSQSLGGRVRGWPGHPENSLRLDPNRFGAILRNRSGKRPNRGFQLVRTATSRGPRELGIRSRNEIGYSHPGRMRSAFAPMAIR